MDAGEDLIADIEQVTPAMRTMADVALSEWGAMREDVLASAGWPARATLGRMMDEGPGASQSTAPGLTSMESAVDRIGEILRIESVVRDLPGGFRLVIVAKYVKGMTMKKAAGGSDRQARKLADRLDQAVDEVAIQLRRLRRFSRKGRGINAH